MRSYFSRHHLLAAAQFCRRAAELERSVEWEPLPGSEKQKVFDEHRGYVIGAVVCSAAFLEAVVNEAFADAAENHTAQLGSLANDAIVKVSSRWARSKRLRGLSVLERFEAFLKEADVPPIPRGKAVYGNVKLLFRLRNAIVHFVPEWRSAGIETDPKDEWASRLMRKFGENPFTGRGNPFFPDKCLSHGCAEWAVQGALAFADAFYAQFQGTPPYSAVRGDVRTS